MDKNKSTILVSDIWNKNKNVKIHESQRGVDSIQLRKKHKKSNIYFQSK